MNLILRPEFEVLREDLVTALSEAERERVELGLSIPKEYGCSVNWYSGPNTCAQAEYNAKRSILRFNVLPSILLYSKSGEERELWEIVKYFEVAKNFFGSSSEDFLLKCMEDPEGYVGVQDFILSNCPEYSEAFLRQKKSYLADRAFLLENGQRAKGLLQKVSNKLGSFKNGFNLSFCVRHELDHLDFFESPLQKDYVRQRLAVADLHNEWSRVRDTRSSKIYKEAIIALLELQSKAVPLSEVRALFFNHIPLGRWTDANFNRLKEEVSSDFSKKYVGHSLLGGIYEKVISASWADGEMDGMISDWLFRSLYNFLGHGKAAFYVVDESLVDFDVVWRTKDNIEDWKEKFRKNAEVAVEVIGNAYRSNPSKLSLANKAKSFEEYLSLCL